MGVDLHIVRRDAVTIAHGLPVQRRQERVALQRRVAGPRPWEPAVSPWSADEFDTAVRIADGVEAEVQGVVPALVVGGRAEDRVQHLGVLADRGRGAGEVVVMSCGFTKLTAMNQSLSCETT
ncbi:hypothetical protein EOT10_19840 [Streptomyces antnestii]|uniref:Uncharacterized protein n=1 Tax=Streptomyces antnestii TaxID=2494256 RepID=A0A3S2VEI8_9ACTN|nr:hypothetical protein [Streptomyces sp. San01]RVU22740.1 hypothetical protein EOT10_19840 [Streptomyces sp. San01]